MIIAHIKISYITENNHKDWLIGLISWLTKKYSSLQKFCYQNENSKLISGKITTIFNDFLHWSGRTYKNLSKSINEHNFLLLCVIFSFTHTFKTLVNILKNTVFVYICHFILFLMDLTRMEIFLSFFGVGTEPLGAIYIQISLLNIYDLYGFCNTLRIT